MKMGALLAGMLVLVSLTGTGLSASEANTNGNFSNQAEKLYQLLESQCQQPFDLLPADDFSGTMLRCTRGSASFLAIAAKPPAAENLQTIRVSWNDAFRTAAGARYAQSDRGSALFFVTAAATLYAPALLEELLAAFEQNQAQTWQAGGISISYSYFRDTLSDERVLTIQPSRL